MEVPDVGLALGEAAADGREVDADVRQLLLQPAHLFLKPPSPLAGEVPFGERLLEADLERRKLGFEFSFVVHARSSLPFAGPCLTVRRVHFGGSMSASTLVYDSAHRGLRAVEEARDLWRYRYFVIELAARDIKVRYKRSALGVAWTMLNPLMTMLVFTLVFSVFQRQPIQKFPVYFLSASLFWTFFSQATSNTANLTTDVWEITRRIYVPRSAFVAGSILVGLVNLLLSLIPFVFVVLVSGRSFFVTWLFLPVALVIGTLFTAGVGLFVFTLASRFWDVRDMYQVLLTPWFFVTPIVYDPSIVPAKWRWIVRYNPMTYLIDLFRAPLYDGWLPGPNTLLFGALAAVASLTLGWFFYSWNIEKYDLGN